MQRPDTDRHLPFRRVDVDALRVRLATVRRRMVAGLLATPASANSDERVAMLEQVARDAVLEAVAARARAEAYRDALQLLAATR